MIFKNRLEAGRLLSQKLSGYQGEKNLVVLAISRGGIAVGRQIASFLNCSFEVFINEKNSASQTRSQPDLKDKIVIVSDDGAATGATMTLAVGIIWQQCPKKIIVAVPVLSRDGLKKIEAVADEVVYLEAPDPFFALSQFYEDF